MTLENSGDSIALPAKELNPFSISPIMVCQITAGSLPLSAIGALHSVASDLPRLDIIRHTTPLRRGGQRGDMAFSSGVGTGSHSKNASNKSRDTAKTSAMRQSVPYSSSSQYHHGTAQGITNVTLAHQ